MKKLFLIIIVLGLILYGIVYGLDAIGIIDLKQMEAEAEQKKKADIEAKENKIAELYSLDNLGYDYYYTERGHDESTFFLIDEDRGVVTRVYRKYTHRSGHLSTFSVSTVYKKDFKGNIIYLSSDISSYVDILKELIEDWEPSSKYNHLFPE